MESCCSSPTTPPTRPVLHHPTSKAQSETRVEKMRIRAAGLPGRSDVQRSIQQHIIGRGGQRGSGGHHSETPVTPQLRKPQSSQVGDHRRDASRTPQGRGDSQFFPRPGDMKIQLNSATMAWVDPKGNILHQWKRTKRGTRGGRNRRVDGNSSPRSTSSVSAVHSRPGLKRETELAYDASDATGREGDVKRKIEEHALHDSDCSSACDFHMRQASAALDISEQESQADGAQMLEMSAEGGTSANLNNMTSADLSDLVSRLYGLVNSLQDENEGLASACAEAKFESQSTVTELSQLKQKLQQVTAERDLLQQQVLFQHDVEHNPAT
eukprot:jgi/Ulvmu1/4971/UM207_0015.1